MNWAQFHHWCEQLRRLRPDGQQRHFEQLPQLLEADNCIGWVMPAQGRGRLLFAAGVSTSAIELFHQHGQQDPYLAAYLNQQRFGHCVELQSLVTIDHCDPQQQRFVRLAQDHLGCRFSLGLITPLSDGSMLATSCHRWQAPFNLAKISPRMHALNIALAPLLSTSQQPINAIAEEPLTASEKHLIALLAEGYNGSEIATVRAVSKETVKSQLKSLLHKTRCRHQNELYSKLLQQLPLLNSSG